MNQKEELKARVHAKKKELEARLATLKADAGAGAREEREKIEQKLSQLGDEIRNGWEELTENVAAKLNRWLEDDDVEDVQA